MAAISRIKPGQTLYTLKREKLGRTVMHRVTVSEVDPEFSFVIASWNGNTPQRFYEGDVRKWRVSEPKPKGKILGMTTY